MKKNWLHLVLLAILTVFIASCAAPKPAEVAEAQQQAEQAAEQAEQAAERASMPGINPDLLPPPRDRLADTPDLYNGTFEVTDAGLESMAGAGVPSDVIDQLKSLRGQSFGNASEFAQALRNAIGASATSTHGRAIMQNSLAVGLTNEPYKPGDPRGLVAAQEMGTMGDERFRPVFFDFDKSNIKSEFLDAVRANAEVLNSEMDLKVVVEGHADERGTTEYNLALGERRARAVRDALIDEGVSDGQLRVVSFGEERPVDNRSNEAAWSKNRRSVLTSQ